MIVIITTLLIMWDHIKWEVNEVLLACEHTVFAVAPAAPQSEHRSHRLQSPAVLSAHAHLFQPITRGGVSAGKYSRAGGQGHSIYIPAKTRKD